MISLDGLDLLSAGTAVTVKPKVLTITGATNAPKIFDGKTTATITGVAFGGLVNGGTLTLGTDYTATAAFTDANAGTDKTATVKVTLGSTVKNYTLAQNTYSLENQTIGKAEVTLTFKDQIITYVETPAPATADPDAAEITFSYAADGGSVDPAITSAAPSCPTAGSETPTTRERRLKSTRRSPRKSQHLG